MKTLENWCCQRGLNSRPLPYQGSEFRDINGFPASIDAERLGNIASYLCGFCAGAAL